MFLRDPSQLRVLLHRAPVDMRKQRNGLAALVKATLEQDPFDGGSLFVFIGRRRNALKILYWDRNGFALWYKVIEGKEKFPWPRYAATESITLTLEQLQWLLEGYDVWKMKPHRTLSFSHVS